MVHFALRTLVAVFCGLVILTPSSEAARILGFFASPSKSHLIIHTAIAEELAKAGHDVTVIATSSNVIKNATYKFIQIDVPLLDENFAREMINKPQPIYKRFGKLLTKINYLANETLSHPTMKEFLRKEKSSFDLIIVGYFFNDFFLGLSAHFNCPVIISFMVEAVFPINTIVGNPSEVAYVPALFLGLKQPLNFLNRVKNFLISIFEQYGMATIMDSFSKKYYSYNFPPDQYPPLEEVKKNVALVFTNHHYISQGPIRPNVPGLVDIGGIQIKEKPNPLPADIEAVLDKAKNGAIYFSFGSNVKGSILSEEKAKIMFNVLSKLPYTVLWKWGDSDFPGTSKNIVYKSWLPQDDILAHPNVKVFITHGGQGSIVESQYHGVPMVGIPLFGDQPSNVAKIVSNGFGLQLDYLTLTEEIFKNAIVEVINNPTYATKVKEFSKLYRDRPLTPRQLVRYWVDYVIRHKGAKHLQSPAVHMTKFQLLSLDVIGFLLLVLTTVVFVLVKLIKLLCCRKKHRADEHKKRQ